jgi:hypothetical protein
MPIFFELNATVSLTDDLFKHSSHIILMHFAWRKPEYQAFSVPFVAAYCHAAICRIFKAAFSH